MLAAPGGPTMQQAHVETAFRFLSAARADFERRLDAAREAYLRLASDPVAGPAVDAICGLDAKARYRMLHRVMADTSGPVTLEGMEGLVGLVSGLVRGEPGYALVPDDDEAGADDGPFLVVVPARERPDAVPASVDGFLASVEANAVIALGWAAAASVPRAS